MRTGEGVARHARDRARTRAPVRSNRARGVARPAPRGSAAARPRVSRGGTRTCSARPSYTSVPWPRRAAATSRRNPGPPGRIDTSVPRRRARNGVARVMSYCPGHGAAHEDRRDDRPRLARPRGARAHGRGGHGRRAAELLPRHRTNSTPRRRRCVRDAAGRAGRPVAILQDLPGPKLRIGALRDDTAELKVGDRVTFVCGNGGRAGDARRMTIAWDGLANAIDPGEILYLADGAVRLRAIAVRGGDGEIDAEVEVGGTVASRQGLNIPGPTRQPPGRPRGGPRAPARRDEDRRRPRRAELRAPPRGRPFVREHTRTPLIAKIEKPQAVERAEEILKVSDCVMVARGDLGIEMPIEQVPIVQKQLLALAGALARPSITATQMLDSMVTSSRPTRAEVADVANAILDGTDAVMLSQETAVGQHPVGAIEMMAAVAAQTERERPYERGTRRACAATSATRPTPLAHSACVAARELSPRRARRPDARGPLGAPDLRAPPGRADLRAVAGPGDGPPLWADVGRAGRVDAPPRDHRGADRRRRPRASSSSAGASPASASGSPPACRAAARDDEPLPGPAALRWQPCQRSCTTPARASATRPVRLGAAHQGDQRRHGGLVLPHGVDARAGLPGAAAAPPPAAARHVLRARGHADDGRRRRAPRARPRSFACVPPGVVHTFSNPSSEPVRFLNFNTPGGFEHYMRELGEAAKAGPLTPDVMGPIASRYDFERA